MICRFLISPSGFFQPLFSQFGAQLRMQLIEYARRWNYEHRISQHLGAGAFGDIAFADQTSTTLGGGVFVHPWERWTLLAGPGVEFSDGDADVIARVGGWYSFPLDKYALAPTAWVDLGDGVAFFVGIIFSIFL